MLINTVILFIRDTLPIFLLFTLLLLQVGVQVRTLVLGTVGGLGAVFLLYFNLDKISVISGGAGLELLKVVALVLVLLLLCEHYRRQFLQPSPTYKIITALLLALITLVNAIHFLIYSISYWHTNNSDTGVLMGTIIGLGISTSLCILLYLILVNNKIYWPKRALLLVFNAGQIATIATLLEQTNVLEDQNRIWNSRAFIADNSEYGHLLNVLVGYEATPTYAYILFYFITIFLPVIYTRLFFIPAIFRFPKSRSL